MVDPESPVAPYRQVALILAERVEDGTYPARLPSIVDLVQEFGVARTTAAKALRLVAADGYAELSPGMGYYAKRPAGDR